MEYDVEHVKDLFEDRYIPEPNSGCWFWVGSMRPDNYGYLCTAGKNRKAHRLSYELHHGPIPEIMLVCHKCDIPFCVNPDHLFLGTRADNTRDCVRKGRARRCKGVEHPKAKLTPEQVLDVVVKHQAGLGQRTIAKGLPVGRMAIRHILKGKSWAWLTNISLQEKH